jgi:dihydroorotase-like cyclic amidohydrolase
MRNAGNEGDDRCKSKNLPCEREAYKASPGGEGIHFILPDRRQIGKAGIFSGKEEIAGGRLCGIFQAAGTAKAPEAAAEAVAQARRRGVAVYNETCPQYLFLNGDDNRHSDEPWRYILQPPLRTLEDNAGLCQAVKSGDVDMIITDHCAYTRQQKENAPTGTPGGLPGLETLLVLTAAIPDMTWCDVARVLAENPARIYGLWPQKGAILPGFDADIVVLKDESYTLDESQLQSFAGYSPFHGKQARGRILRVFRRGEEIVREGKTLASKGSGHTVMPHC